LEIADQYAERILTRYRPDIRDRKTVLRKLSRSYPTHDFIIDVEELREIGIPARPAAGKEIAIIGRLEAEMIPYIGTGDRIEKFTPVAAKKKKKATLPTKKKPPATKTDVAKLAALRSVP
jgi:hypothetical protein